MLKIVTKLKENSTSTLFQVELVSFCFFVKVYNIFLYPLFCSTPKIVFRNKHIFFPAQVHFPQNISLLHRLKQ